MSAYIVEISGARHTVQLKERRGALLTLVINDQERTVTVEPATQHRHHPEVVISPTAFKGPAAGPSNTGVGATVLELKAPLPGIVSDVKVSKGDMVSAGSTLVVIDAMKMENPIKAPRDVTIKSVEVKKGQEVAHGAVLISFEAPST